MGETREMRIKEFHHFNNQPVIGLREGSWIRVHGDQIELKGENTARMFSLNCINEISEIRIDDF